MTARLRVAGEPGAWPVGVAVILGALTLGVLALGIWSDARAERRAQAEDRARLLGEDA